MVRAFFLADVPLHFIILRYLKINVLLFRISDQSWFDPLLLLLNFICLGDILTSLCVLFGDGLIGVRFLNLTGKVTLILIKIFSISFLFLVAVSVLFLVG